MTAVEDWAPAPARPTLDDEEVAVWRLSSAAPRPIEAVLARYLAVEPSSLTLGRTPAGKPELAGTQFRVSLAHGGGVALVAVTEGRDVGVDVEPARPSSDRWTLVDHALTPDERRQLGRVPPAQRACAFLSMWTRKEALLKAAGVGLAVDPRLVELDGVSVRAVPPTLGSALDWTVVDVPLPDHLAALAVRGGVANLTLYAPPSP